MVTGRGGLVYHSRVLRHFILAVLKARLGKWGARNNERKHAIKPKISRSAYLPGISPSITLNGAKMVL